MSKVSALAGALLLALLCALQPAAADPTHYPLTVTDLAGRQVTIPEEPRRIALQDGRDILELALLDRAEPGGRVAVWNNVLAREDDVSWKLVAGRWPQVKTIPDMGFGDNGQVNAEQIVAARPQLVIAQRRALGSLQEAGVDKRLAELNIPLLFVDTFNAPVSGAPDTVRLLGQVLNRNSEASDYVSFYQDHLNRLRNAIAAETIHPRVFVEVLAGRQGVEQCCTTHGKVGWGQLVEAVGATNIGSTLLSKNSGEVTLETVIAQKPDVYVLTGRAKAGGSMVPLGYDADHDKVEATLKAFEDRPGFSAVSAARTGRVFGIWHLFYNHPYNIVALEWLAKFCYPQAFATLDPAETYKTILARFTQIPAEPFIQAAQAPRLAGPE